MDRAELSRLLQQVADGIGGAEAGHRALAAGPLGADGCRASPTSASPASTPIAGCGPATRRSSTARARRPSRRSRSSRRCSRDGAGPTVLVTRAAPEIRRGAPRPLARRPRRRAARWSVGPLPEPAGSRGRRRRRHLGRRGRRRGGAHRAGLRRRRRPHHRRRRRRACTGCWPPATEFAAADCLIVVAGMEGALPSVVGGLVGTPLVAVPTSVGYGASFGGLAALLAMLNSCAPGVVVCNIDNGFGAGVFAARVARRCRRAGAARRIGWLDLSSGASGDMLLGALVGRRGAARGPAWSRRPLGAADHASPRGGPAAPGSPPPAST